MPENNKQYGQAAKQTKMYLAQVKAAYNFYSQSPDGQYDDFVANLLRQEYFAITGEDLEK